MLPAVPAERLREAPKGAGRGSAPEYQDPIRHRPSRAVPPASPGRRQVRILYATQKTVAPPTFIFFTNVATEFHFSYERFLMNRLRESFGLMGTPIRIQVRRREK